MTPKAPDLFDQATAVFEQATIVFESYVHRSGKYIGRIPPNSEEMKQHAALKAAHTTLLGLIRKEQKAKRKKKKP